MSTKVRCLLCIDKALKTLNTNSVDRKKAEDELVKSVPHDIQSKIIAKSDEEAAKLLGAELYLHMQACHPMFNLRTTELLSMFTGFSLMKYFEAPTEDEPFEKEKEKMRDLLVEEIMMYASDDDEEEEEDDYENDLTDDEEDEDNPEERESDEGTLEAQSTVVQ